MIQVNFSDVSKVIGARTLFKNASLVVEEGDRIGFIGCNGTGKTTLFQMILGKADPDTGSIAVANGLEAGYLSQNFNLNEEHSLLEATMGAFAHLAEMEHKLEELSEKISHSEGAEQERLMEEYSHVQTAFETGGGYTCKSRAEKILMGLGFSQMDFVKPLKVLSGGQKNRAAMARLFLWSPPLLLLDEPTNFLDMQATEWLEDFLNGYKGTFIVVSHDRYFLDRVARKIWEIERQTVTEYPGNFTRSRALKEEWVKSYQREYEKQAKKLAKEEEFIRRYKAGQRAKEAKGREKRLERVERMEEWQDDTPRMQFRLKPLQPSGVDILKCKDLSMAYGFRTLFSNLEWEVQRGQKIGIIGPNGTGKSTLLKVLLGQARQTRGKIKWGEALQVEYYDQEHRGLNRDNTLFKEISQIGRELNDEQVRSYLGAFLFKGTDVEKYVHDLSGGERARLALAKMILLRPNVLMLDEPTNHLDIASREALESALRDYEGTILVVSHDRYFLNQVADRILHIEKGATKLYYGNYDQYKAKSAGLVDAAVSTTRSGEASGRSGRKEDARQQHRVKKDNERRLQKAETEIYRREERLKALAVELEKPEIYSNAERCREIASEQKTLQSELAEWYRQWEELSALDRVAES